MSDPSHLPAWVSYAQALAVPILAAAVAAFGAWIARQQMLIAHDKHKHDVFMKTYEQRFAVYEATRAILAEVFIGDISDDQLRAYGMKTLDAQFLFDADMYKYLREVRDRIAAWRKAASSSNSATDAETKREWKRLEAENRAWIQDQGDGPSGFDKRFLPFLSFTPIPRPRLWR